MSLDLSSAIMDCAVPVTVTRFYPSARVKGRSIDPTFKTFDVMMSVQPLTARELQRLPEGKRQQSRVKAYGVNELMTVETSECRQPDEFEWRGNRYQIDDIEDWEVGGFFKFGAERVNR